MLSATVPTLVSAWKGNTGEVGLLLLQEGACSSVNTISNILVY